MDPRALHRRSQSHYLQLKVVKEVRRLLRAWAASFVVTRDTDSATVPRGHLLQVSSFGKGSKKGTYWVEALTGSPLAFVGMVMDENEVSHNTDGYGVLDLGATETVGSLGALEALMEIRSSVHGIQEPVEVDLRRRNLFALAMVEYKSPQAMSWFPSALEID